MYFSIHYCFTDLFKFKLYIDIVSFWMIAIINQTTFDANSKEAKLDKLRYTRSYSDHIGTIK